MKNIYITTIIYLILNNFLIAQDNSSFGLKLGTSFSSTNAKTANITADLTLPKGVGFNFGGFYDYALNDSFGLIGNLVYNNKNINFSTDKYIITLNYLDLNPMVKFDPNRSYGKGFYIKSGFTLSTLLSAKEKQTKVDVKNSFKSTSFSLNLAFGVDFLQYLGLETFLDYSIGDTLKSGKSNLFQASLLINVNIEKIIYRK